MRRHSFRGGGHPPLVAGRSVAGVTPAKRRLLIEADAGGANAATQVEEIEGGIQGLADPFGLIITVTHYPPGASKWNPIDHRMFRPESAVTGPRNRWSTIKMILGYIPRGHARLRVFTAEPFLDTTDYPTGYRVTPRT